MIDAGRFGGVIDQAYLPTEVDPERFTADGAVLLAFGYEPETSDVLEGMMAQGYMPGTAENLLAYAAFGDLPKCKNFAIVALGTQVSDPDSEDCPETGYPSRVPCVYGGIGRQPTLTMELDGLGNRWGDGENTLFIYFLAVHKP